jgi:hypothetical protein
MVKGVAMILPAGSPARHVRRRIEWANPYTLSSICGMARGRIARHHQCLSGVWSSRRAGRGGQGQGQQREVIMEHESDWVADVRRWCLTGTQARAAAQQAPNESGHEADNAALGYEAAHPALQSCHWPDAPRGEPTDRG